MPTRVKALLEAANVAAPRLPPAEVHKLIDQGNVLSMFVTRQRSRRPVN
jgi:hypothetical protein